MLYAFVLDFINFFLLCFRDSADVTILKKLCNLLKDFWFTSKKFCLVVDNLKEDLENEEAKLKKLHETFPIEYFLVLLSFIKKLK